VTDRAHALRIIESLRQGSNLLEGVDLISVGREGILVAAVALLEELSQSGGSAVRWMKGPYGVGKTHTVALIRRAAQERNWVASYVVVSGRGQGCELHRFHEVYGAIVQNCVLPHGRTNANATNGWSEVLDSWVNAIKRQTGARPGGDVASLKVRDAIHGTITGLALKHGVRGSYAAALRSYAFGHIEGDQARCAVLLDWFAGTDVFKQSPEIKKSLRSEGILEAISPRNAKVMLRQMTSFLRYRGYNGFLVLFDEVENVLHLAPATRRAAYTIVRELVDNVDAINGMTQTLLYFSGTPDLFDSAKGIGEYEALASRVLLPRRDMLPNPSASVVDLADFPITPENMRQMAERIGHVYEIAYSGVDSREISTDVSGLLDRHQLQSPRLWVRSVVEHLDRQNRI
jgi:hypothetical protein